jgi:hypothetical protein
VADPIRFVAMDHYDSSKQITVSTDEEGGIVVLATDASGQVIHAVHMTLHRDCADAMAKALYQASKTKP